MIALFSRTPLCLGSQQPKEDHGTKPQTINAEGRGGGFQLSASMSPAWQGRRGGSWGLGCGSQVAVGRGACRGLCQSSSFVFYSYFPNFLQRPCTSFIMVKKKKILGRRKGTIT